MITFQVQGSLPLSIINYGVSKHYTGSQVSDSCPLGNLFVMQMFCQFYLRTRAFYTWHVHDSPYSSFGRKEIEPIMFYEVINAKAFSRSIAFAIAVVVTPRSSSFEYTISVHAVHAGAERNVCNIVVSTETPQNFHQSIPNAAPRVQTSTLVPAPPQRK